MKYLSESHLIRAFPDHTDQSASVKTMIRSPVTVLMSVCRLTTFMPAMSEIAFSKSGWVLPRSSVPVCLTNTRPVMLSSLSDSRFSARVRTHWRRTTTISSIHTSWSHQAKGYEQCICCCVVSGKPELVGRFTRGIRITCSRICRQNTVV